MKKPFKRIKALFLALENKFINKSAQPFYGNYATVILRNYNFETMNLSIFEYLKREINYNFTIKAIKITTDNHSQMYECIKINSTKTNHILYRFTPEAHKKETDCSEKLAILDLTKWNVLFDAKRHDLKIDVQAKTTVCVTIFSNDFSRNYYFN